MNKKMLVVGVAVAVLLGVGGAAFAYFTVGGTGTGTAPIGDASALTVSVVSPTVSLFPTSFTDGNKVVDTVTYTVTNGGEGNVSLGTVVAGVTPGWSYTDAAKDPACTAADFSINGQAVGAPAITTGSSVTLNGGSDGPNNVYTGSFTIQMVDNGLNQDSCQSGSVPLTVTVGTTNLLSDIDYYTTTSPVGTFSRSLTPIVTPPVTDTVSSGDVTLSIAATTPGTYVDNGFYIELGTLGSLHGYTITGTGANTFGDNLWFGTNPPSGDFFEWNADGTIGASYGVTTYGLGPTSSGGTVTVNGSSTFFMVNGSCKGTSPTLASLVGTCGLTASTPVAIWVGITSPSGAAMSATITSVQAY
jgi:hypothetical protein